jgi:hypothetical protein
MHYCLPAPSAPTLMVGLGWFYELGINWILHLILLSYMHVVVRELIGK